MVYPRMIIRIENTGDRERPVKVKVDLGDQMNGVTAYGFGKTLPEAWQEAINRIAATGTYDFDDLNGMALMADVQWPLL